MAGHGIDVEAGDGAFGRVWGDALGFDEREGGRCAGGCPLERPLERPLGRPLEQTLREALGCRTRLIREYSKVKAEDESSVFASGSSPERDVEGLSLVLVGVVHLDPAGPGLLEELLERLEPEVITVEVSPYAVEFRTKRGLELVERLARFRRPDGSLPGGLSGVEAQLRMPFEVEVARRWASRGSGCRVRLVGDSEISRRYLELFERETMSRENLERLARLPELDLETEAFREWERARACWKKAPVMGTKEARAWRSREEALAARIARSIGGGGSGRDVGGVDDGMELGDGIERGNGAQVAGAGVEAAHVGGWRHVTGLAVLVGALLNEECEPERARVRAMLLNDGH